MPKSYPERICEHCGKRYPPQAPHQEYCKTACRVEAFRARHLEEQIERGVRERVRQLYPELEVTA